MSDEMEEIVKEFLIESYDNLDQLDRDLVSLEKDPASKEILSSIFRTIHTIKGTCGFLSFSKLESVSHVGESLLSLLREGKLVMNPQIADGLLKLVDAIREMLACIESTRKETEKDFSSLVNLLNELQTGNPATIAPKAADPVVESALEKKVDQKKEDLKVEMPVLKEVPPMAEEAEKPEELVVAETAAEGKSHSVSDSNIRVDVGLLDKLMNLVGELVLARNQVLQFNAREIDPGFQATTQRLDLITSELQEGVMKTRMQPIGNVWSKFPRVVRDLSVSCGKDIVLEMEGKDTELDKTIIESIKDPLTHLVRNSVDHGIEAPEARVKSGKKRDGRLYLKAYHEGGKVNIEITDDGAGINIEKVKKKAIEKSLIGSEQASRMSDRELMNLIFLPGFSTADKITNISGRGVGMDVVKTSVEKIGGTIDIQSQLGAGTTFKIKIPLTLAIIPALIVTCGGDQYAIPQVSLLELVRLDGEQAKNGVESIHGTPVYRLRGNLLPLVYLSELLKIKPDDEEETAKKNIDEAVNIVVLQAEDRQFGLVVEAINDTEEIVVKPLGKQFKGLTQFSGATIMGDGKVALILDVLGIGQASQVVSEVKEKSLSENKDRETDKDANHQTMLLFGVGKDGRVAIPLNIVSRLEEFQRKAVEKAAGHNVVQYRDQIMPLIDLSRELQYESDPSQPQRDKINVVVYSRNGRSIGLVVDQILDVVEESLAVTAASQRRGLKGSAVIQKRVTDLIDIDAVIQASGVEKAA